MAEDSRIAEFARRQQGNVTRQQLLKLGLGSAAIQHRIKTRRLFPVYRGVYGVGRPPLSPLEKAAAAVLACDAGAGAALSHSSAMALWGFGKRWPTNPHVTVKTDRRRPGIKIHRATTLTRADVTTHYGIRATTPARTLLDCAPQLSDAALKRAVNDAILSPYLTPDALADVLARHPRHRGAKRLAAAFNPDQNATRSPFEDDFGLFCRHFGLPQPQVNVIVGGHERDAYFEAERLVVELDGWEYHRTRAAFEADRDRDAHTLALGIWTVRITRTRLRTAPAREAARLRGILAARREAA